MLPSTQTAWQVSSVPEIPDKYMVVTAGTAAELTAKVNEAMANGWTPQGGVTMAMTESELDGYQHFELYFAQAMVRA